jgi:hypothetical protein
MPRGITKERSPRLGLAGLVPLSLERADNGQQIDLGQGGREEAQVKSRTLNLELGQGPDADSFLHDAHGAPVKAVVQALRLRQPQRGRRQCSLHTPFTRVSQ